MARPHQGAMIMIKILRAAMAGAFIGVVIMREKRRTP